MTKYNKYAQELDNAFKEARKQYLKLNDDVAWAKSKLANAKGTTDQAVAEARLMLAKENLRTEGEKVWNDFYRTRDKIGKELAAEVRKNNLAVPEGVDMNAIELIKSGVLNADEIANLEQKYDNNVTMLKIIGKYAQDKATNEKDSLSTDDRTTLYNVAFRCSSADNGVMQSWESLSRGVNYCSGVGGNGERRREAAHAVAIGAKWEELYGKAIEEF